MNFVPRFLRRAWRHLGLKLGFYKPKVYVPDARISSVINRIVCSSTATGAFIVAVETKQAMMKIMSYMEKNAIQAVAIAQGDLDLGRFPMLTLRYALASMEAHPERFQVVVMFKHVAAVGWAVPAHYHNWWGQVFMVSTFHQREPWRTQFNGRLRGRVEDSFQDSAYSEG